MPSSRLFRQKNQHLKIRLPAINQRRRVNPALGLDLELVSEDLEADSAVLEEWEDSEEWAA